MEQENNFCILIVIKDNKSIDTVTSFFHVVVTET